MAKPTKDDYLEFYGGLTQYSCYLKEVFKKEKSQGIGLGIGSSFRAIRKRSFNRKAAQTTRQR